MCIEWTPVYYDCGEGALNRHVVSPRPNPINHSKWGVVHYMYVPHITVRVHACTCSEIGLACVCVCVCMCVCVQAYKFVTGVFKLHGFSGDNQIVDITTRHSGSPEAYMCSYVPKSN